jgi:hypothetical protein
VFDFSQYIAQKQQKESTQNDRIWMFFHLFSRREFAAAKSFHESNCGHLQRHFFELKYEAQENRRKSD